MSDQLLKEILDGQQLIIKTLQKHSSQLQDLQSRLASVEKNQLRMETRMENEVIEKVDALFDGYNLRGDQIENLKKQFDQRLESIEIDTGYLVAKVARLEKMAK